MRGEATKCADAVKWTDFSLGVDVILNRPVVAPYAGGSIQAL